jgi:hypothetical protein
MAASGKAVWVGRVLSFLPVPLFVFSAVMKLSGKPEVVEGMAKLGLPQTMLFPLAILELTCILIYVIPQTAVVGAILMTGYIGGALCTHWRVGQPFFMHIVLGILFWLGLYLRDERLRPLMPIRKL